MKSKEFLKNLLAFAANLRKTIEADCDGFKVDSAASAERRAKVMADDGYEYFVETYFPHYVRHDSKSHLHVHLFKRLPQIVAASESQNDATAAPRGEA